MSRCILQTALPALGRSSLLMAAAVLVLPVVSTHAADVDPLHVRIEQQIQQGHTGPVAELCTDAEFFRRVSLDLNGTIPTSTQARAFLDDKSPDKRQKLVDKLLNSPRYHRHMANVFDVMLMERRRDKHVKSPEWQTYLHQSFVNNKPYNQLVREILGADGVDAKLRPAAKFTLDRDAEANLLTRDVGRLFFGMDLQCAQCHDHPLVDSYLQSDYYGLYAFMNRSYVFTDKKQKKSFLAEKAEGAVSFKSVFTGDAGKTRPRLPGGTELVEPVFVPGEDYTVKPAKEVRPVPKYSRRSQLAELATSGSNRAFNRNIVNRLWAHMMGRGLVHPVDFLHPDNPPSHPELLDLLADDFAAKKFNIKAFLRELALSQTYQRSIEIPADLAQKGDALAKQIPSLEAELKRQSEVAEKSLAAVETAHVALEPLKKAADEAEQKLGKSKSVVTAAQKSHAGPAKALATARQQLTAKQSIAKVVADASAKTQVVLKLLPKEKDIAAAAGTLQARTQKLNAEVEALKKTASQKEAAAKPTADKLAVAKKATAEVIPGLLRAHKAMTPAQEKIAASTSQNKLDYTFANATEKRIEELNALAAYSKLAAAHASSQTVLTAVQAKRIAEKKTMEQNTAVMTKSNTELSQAQKTVTQASAELASTRKRLQTRQNKSTLVNDAVSKMKLASVKIPNDKKLALATQQISVRAEQLKQELNSLQKQTTSQEAVLNSAKDRVTQTQKTVETSHAAIKKSQTALSSLENTIKQSQSQVDASRSAVDGSFEKLAEKWTNRFAVASVRPLSPESMSWSMMQATGMTERQQTTEEAALKKKNPKAWEAKTEEARATELEAAVYNKLKGNVTVFVGLFGAGAGQPQNDFFATVDQALFLSNAGQVRGWLNPSGGNLVDRLNKTKDSQALVEELYLSVLTRRPDEQETAEIEKYLASRQKDRVTAIQEITWALLTSSEFRFNH